MFSRIWRVIAPFIAALVLFGFLLIAFGGGTGVIELAIFLVVSALFGWWIGRTTNQNQDPAPTQK